VKVYAASLNPVDYKILEGFLWMLCPLQPKPFIPGFDISGEVVEVGANCKRFKKGDKIYAMANFLRCGALAEYVAISEDLVALKPSNLTFAEAATVPLACETSYQSLVTSARLKSGERVFINGGSGGTGTFGIQIAKYLGAEVATTCSERNIELVKSLGADHIIDYNKKDPAEELHDYDVVYDCVGGYDVWEKALKILKPTGRFVTIAGDKQSPIGPMSVAKNASSLINRSFWWAFGKYPSYSLVLAKSNSADLIAITDMIEQEKIRTIIDRSFSLDDSIEAFKYQMSGRVRGKLVIEIDTACQQK